MCLNGHGTSKPASDIFARKPPVEMTGAGERGAFLHKVLVSHVASPPQKRKKERKKACLAMIDAVQPTRGVKKREIII